MPTGAALKSYTTVSVSMAHTSNIEVSMALTINGDSWKKYRIWVVVIRILLMGIPAVLTSVFEWLFDRTENILMWLDYKLPDPMK